MFNDQDKDFDNIRFTNIDSITINRKPNSDSELANKKYVDEENDKTTIIRSNQTLEKCSEFSVGDDAYTLENKKKEITDSTVIIYSNEAG